MSVLQVEFLDGISERVTNPTIQRLTDQWQSRCDTETDIPEAGGFDLGDLAWCEDNLMLLEAIGDGDFRYLHYGAAIAEVSQFDMTGKTVSDFKSDVGEFFRKKYLHCLAIKRPIYTRHTAKHAKAVTTWERLLLPLRNPAGPARILVYNRPIEFRHEFLESILYSSTEGIIHYRETRNDDMEVIEFRSTTINPVAMEIVNQQSFGGISDADLHVLSPCSVPQLFERCREVADGGAAQPFELDLRHGDQPARFRVNAGHTGDGVTVTFSDITESWRQAEELKQINRDLEAEQTSLRYANQVLEEQAVQLAELAEEREAARLEVAGTNRQLEQEMIARNRLESELRVLATTDSLTGVMNRRAFFEAAETEAVRARRYGRPLTVVMLDIDHFKSINDRFGHAVGDDTIRLATSICQRTVRQQDLVGRLGGEEFAILLVEADVTEAMQCAERLRTAIEAEPIGAKDQSIHMTVSLGIAAMTPRHESVDAILHDADEALYRAKSCGRNRAELAA